jgi:hypothetical protein
MIKMLTVGTIVALLLGLSPSLRAQESEVSEPLVADRTGKGALTLNATGSGEDSRKRLDVNIGRNDGDEPVTGVADVIGFPLIDSGPWGDVDWKVSGSTVTGVVRDRDGEVEGTFEGTMTPTGVSGKFTHRDGRVGLWSWEGPLPSK